jgi:hypothetical protein
MLSNVGICRSSFKQPLVAKKIAPKRSKKMLACGVISCRTLYTVEHASPWGQNIREIISRFSLAKRSN